MNIRVESRRYIRCIQFLLYQDTEFALIFNQPAVMFGIERHLDQAAFALRDVSSTRPNGRDPARLQLAERWDRSDNGAGKPGKSERWIFRMKNQFVQGPGLFLKKGPSCFVTGREDNGIHRERVFVSDKIHVLALNANQAPMRHDFVAVNLKNAVPSFVEKLVEIRSIWQPFWNPVPASAPG